MSNNVVSLAGYRQDLIDNRWAEYVSAAHRAQHSLLLEGGIAAGRAWRAWLTLFMTPEQRDMINGGARHPG